jgi:hypothetical protein
MNFTGGNSSALNMGEGIHQTRRNLPEARQDFPPDMPETHRRD